MEKEMRYDGKVVVVTGAGVGLGRAYALFFAKRGAKVVVNDLGTSHTGSGTTSSAADNVVKEIKSFGGHAVANYDSVEHGEKLIKTAIDNYGRIDILVNNAGILRDKAFKNLNKDDWDLIIRVHLNGVYATTKAAFGHMIKQKYGRIINVSSPSGLYGSYGQVNYSAAKAGIVGFTTALAKEGQKYNIYSNVIAPVAATRMTETVLSKDILDKLKPEYVVPIVAYLCHESSTENGSVFEVAGRWVSKLRWQRTEGAYFLDSYTPETLKEQFDSITNFEKGTVSYPTDSTSAMQNALAAEEKISLKANKTSGKGLKSDEIFILIKNYLASGDGKELTKKVDAVFLFDITEKKGGPVVKTWNIDLKTGNGSCKEGTVEKADATFTMTDEDFSLVCNRKLNPQMAFIQVKLF